MTAFVWTPKGSVAARLHLAFKERSRRAAPLRLTKNLAIAPKRKLEHMSLAVHHEKYLRHVYDASLKLPWVAHEWLCGQKCREHGVLRYLFIYLAAKIAPIGLNCNTLQHYSQMKKVYPITPLHMS